MSSNTYRNRYYSKKKYEAAIETLGCGFVFLFVAILSLFFLSFGVPFMGLRSWGYWLFIPAFFIILGGVQQYYTNEKFQKSVRVAILDRGNQGTHKLEDIALEVGIKPKETGEIILGEKVAYVKSEEYVVPPKQLAEPLETKGKGYCVYCGHELTSEGNFCENCGSKI